MRKKSIIVSLLTVLVVCSVFAGMASTCGGGSDPNPPFATIAEGSYLRAAGGSIVVHSQSTLTLSGVYSTAAGDYLNGFAGFSLNNLGDTIFVDSSVDGRSIVMSYNNGTKAITYSNRTYRM